MFHSGFDSYQGILPRDFLEVHPLGLLLYHKQLFLLVVTLPFFCFTIAVAYKHREVYCLVSDLSTFSYGVKTQQ